MRTLQVAAFALFVAACDRATSADAAIVPDVAPDAARPVIDTAPYYQACDGGSEPCPPPYECVVPAASHDLGMVCLLPCETDTDCPSEFFCNGANQQTDVGALWYCAENV